MTGKIALVPEAEAASKARLRLWLRMLKVTRKIEAELRERLRVDFATTLPRFDVLAALSRHPAGLKMSALSGVLRVSNGNVTGIVDRLVEEGLVVRVPVAGDRRAMVVRLTEPGHSSFDTQAAEHEAWIDQMLSGLEPAEVRAYSGRLQALSVALDAEKSKDAT